MFASPGAPFSLEIPFSRPTPRSFANLLQGRPGLNIPALDLPFLKPEKPEEPEKPKKPESPNRRRAAVVRRRPPRQSQAGFLAE